MEIVYSYFRYTARFFLGCAFFVTWCDIIRAWYETKKEKLSYRKKYVKEFVWGTSLFWLHTLLSTAHPPFYVIFIAFFVYFLPLPKWRTCWMTPYKGISYYYEWYFVWLYHEQMVKNMKISCNLILAGWHLSEHDNILDFVLASVVLIMTLHQ